MIDPHVHCRDWEQSNKETICHALSVAEKAGLSAIFDMPNTNPPITTEELVLKRLEDAKKCNNGNGKIIYGLYIGLTNNADQIRQAVQLHKKLFPNVVGFKLFAGHSVGKMGLISEQEQKNVYQILTEENYEGVVAVHCEKEDLLIPEAWDPSKPVTHSLARPAVAETESVKDQIRFATHAGFKGHLHICHISVPEAVELVVHAKQQGMKISCGVTPHHCLMHTGMYDSNLFKMNPPLRNKDSAEKMIEYLKDGSIDYIETDHAPHLLKEKLEEPFMSGIPGLAFYPHFIKYLRSMGFTDEQLQRITHHNICKIFNIVIPFEIRAPNYLLAEEYEFDPYEKIKKSWN